MNLPLTPKKPAPLPQTMPQRPLHDEGGTLASLIRQRLMQVDKDSVDTIIPTQELLLVLCSTLNLIEQGRIDSSNWQKKYFEVLKKGITEYQKTLTDANREPASVTA